MPDLVSGNSSLVSSDKRMVAPPDTIRAGNLSNCTDGNGQTGGVLSGRRLSLYVKMVGQGGGLCQGKENPARVREIFLPFGCWACLCPAHTKQAYG
jgi:hypothetical protein